MTGRSSSRSMHMTVVGFNGWWATRKEKKHRKFRRRVWEKKSTGKKELRVDRNFVYNVSPSFFSEVVQREKNAFPFFFSSPSLKLMARVGGDVGEMLSRVYKNVWVGAESPAKDRNAVERDSSKTTMLLSRWLQVWRKMFPELRYVCNIENCLRSSTVALADLWGCG